MCISVADYLYSILNNKCTALCLYDTLITLLTTHCGIERCVWHDYRALITI